MLGGAIEAARCSTRAMWFAYHQSLVAEHNATLSRERDSLSDGDSSRA